LISIVAVDIGKTNIHSFVGSLFGWGPSEFPFGVVKCKCVHPELEKVGAGLGTRGDARVGKVDIAGGLPHFVLG